MSKHEDLMRLKEHLAKNTTVPFILQQTQTDYCVCYLLLGGFSGTMKMLWRYVFCKLAELSILGAGKNFFYRLAGAKIGRGVIIAPGTVLDYLCINLIEIEDECVLGMGSMILAHEFTFKESRVGRVHLGKKVTLGARSVVRAGITIGDNAIVGMFSLVTKDVPPDTTVVGIPGVKME